MGFSNISGCTSILTYEHALAHWNREPAPKAKRRGTNIWQPDQKPLDDARKWHYRIERGPDGAYFGVHLYHTEMCRWYRPEADGTRRVDYTNHSKNLSKQFMWRMGFCNELALQTAGDFQRSVLVPVAYEELGTTIWYDAAGRVITCRSHHAPVYRRVSSPEQKEWRKTLKASTRNLAFLLEAGMVVPEPSPNSWGRSSGRPFTGVDIKWDTKQALHYFDGELTEDTTHLQIEALQAVWQACLQFLVDKRDYGANAKAYSWHRQEVKEHKEPTPQEVTRSFYKALERICRTPNGAKERIPDWSSGLPKNYCF